MSIFTTFFNALLRGFGYVDPTTSRDPLIFIALVIAGVALYYGLQAKGRIAAAAHGSMNKIVNDRMQELAIKVGDLNSKLTTTVTEQDKQLMLLKKKVSEMEQILKKIYSGAETAALKFDDGFDVEARLKRLEEGVKGGENGELAFADDEGTEESTKDAQKTDIVVAEIVPTDRHRELLQILCAPTRQTLLPVLHELPTIGNGSSPEKKREEGQAKLETTLKSLGFGDELSNRFASSLTQQLPTTIAASPEILTAAVHQAMRTAYGPVLRSEVKGERVLGRAAVICLVGEKGAGKSLLAVRLTLALIRQGRRVLLATTDRLTPERAREIDKWSHSHDVPVVFGSNSKKPQAVAYQSIHKALDENCDAVILEIGGADDLAQGKEELKAVLKMIQREQPGAPHEILLVVDGSRPNELHGTRELMAETTVTGLCVTKLDKAQQLGAVLALRTALNSELRYLSMGVTAEDVAPFSLDKLSAALVGDAGEADDGVGSTQNDGVSERV